MPKVDVVIAGGGAVGSATAYFLTERTGFTRTVAVVEPDPTYHLAASTLTVIGRRSRPVDRFPVDGTVNPRSYPSH